MAMSLQGLQGDKLRYFLSVGQLYEFASVEMPSAWQLPVARLRQGSRQAGIL